MGDFCKHPPGLRALSMIDDLMRDSACRRTNALWMGLQAFRLLQREVRVAGHRPIEIGDPGVWTDRDGIVVVDASRLPTPLV